MSTAIVLIARIVKLCNTTTLYNVSAPLLLLTHLLCAQHKWTCTDWLAAVGTNLRLRVCVQYTCSTVYTQPMNDMYKTHVHTSHANLIQYMLHNTHNYTGTVIIACWVWLFIRKLLPDMDTTTTLSAHKCQYSYHYTECMCIQ